MVYADSSALVKLLIEEPESVALGEHLTRNPRLVVSSVGAIEVTRTVRMAAPADSVWTALDRLLNDCMVVSPSDEILIRASEIADVSLRTLDAIHLATALWADLDELIAYDRRLLSAAQRYGLGVASPGAAL